MIITGLTGAFVANYVLAALCRRLDRAISGWAIRHGAGCSGCRRSRPAIFLLALLIIPESPRFLVAKGREAEAHDGADAPVRRGRGATARSPRSARSLAADHHQPKLSDLRRQDHRQDPPDRLGGHRPGRSSSSSSASTSSSITARCCGRRSASPRTTRCRSTSCRACCRSRACLFTIATVDRIGRKPLLLVGSAGMAVTLARGRLRLLHRGRLTQRRAAPAAARRRASRWSRPIST